MNKKEKIKYILENKDKLVEEYQKRLDVIYTQYHAGQYYADIEAMRKDLEAKYNCKIKTNGFFEIECIDWK